MEDGIPPLDEAAMEAAERRQANLTKPPGSLGRLEEFSIQIAGMTGQEIPTLDEAVITTVAGDHGVVEEGISAFPQDVTAQMVSNFAHEGAAVNALAHSVGAENLIVDVGVATEAYPGMDAVVVDKIRAGTDNIATGAAMTEAEARQVVDVGRNVLATHAAEADIIGLGDMGIGNTTPSAAITAAITGADPKTVTGRGTGVDDAAFERKVAVVERALETDAPDPDDGYDVLRSVGGFEIGALAGIALEAASRRIPVVVDGFITGAGALVAARIDDRVTDYLLASHSSVESGHEVQYDELGLEALFDFEMRLGEGTGAALGISVYQGACRVLEEMATFEEAGVTN